MARITGPALPWSIILIVVVSALVGAIADPARRGLDAVFYALFPVLEMQTKIVELGADDVLLSVSGNKRWACQFEPPLAVELTLPNGGRRDSNAARMDRPEYGSTRPTGLIAPQLWRVSPLDGAKAVTVYANHICDGRLVSSVFAYADLAQAVK